MKAVIMAGGAGSRLKPLTCTKPKPMARLCGRPILEYILDLLDQNGFTEARLTLGYLPNCVTEHFADGQYKGVSLQFVTEPQPLGTAGGVRNAAADFDEDFLVISGDAMCDFNLADILRFHRDNKADATLVVKRVEDPREYGLVNVNAKDYTVMGFVEKPCYAQAICDLANTGVYVISPRALSHVPDDRPFDFAKDLFPLMLKNSERVLAYEEKGYWCDVGDLDSLRRCAADMLAGKVRCNIDATEIDGVYYKDKNDAHRIHVNPPAYIGAGVTIEQGCRIGEGSVIDDGACIGARASIMGSLIGTNAVLGDDVHLRGSVVCEGAVVESGARLFEGSAIGAKAVVGNRAIVEPGVKIWPKKYVKSGTVLREHLRTGTLGRELFDDEGVCIESPGEMTPAMCARLGGAIGTVLKQGVCGISHMGKAGRALADALSAGIRQTGCSVLDFGECIEPQGVFSSVHCKAKLGAHVEAGRIRLFGEDGLTLRRDIEREIELCMLRAEVKSVAFEKYGKLVRMESVAQLYPAYLKELCGENLTGMTVSIACKNVLLKRILHTTLDELSCNLSRAGRVRLHVSDDGLNLCVSQNGGPRISDERIFVLLAEHELAIGNNLAVRYDAPRVLDYIAEDYGREVLRYLSCPADDSDRRARVLAKNQAWVRDALARSVMLLTMLHKTGKDLYDLCSALPEFEEATRIVTLRKNPCEVMRRIGGTGAQGAIGEGLVVPFGGGTVLVRPLKRGGGVRIMAEAANYEIAKELCGGFEKLIKDFEGGTSP